jgi:hypothetical protein
MEQPRVKSKPIEVKIISPAGLSYHSHEIPEVAPTIQSITARGVIPMEGNYNNITGEAIYEFEILPDHSPLVSKIAPDSKIILFGNFEKGPDLKFLTEHGGIITTNFDDEHTQVVFTLQDVEKFEEKK